eukprot:EC719839.1.p1 GENE.EC719839.1~~EC719839.1.p1  ORF type:complete len:94 (+),score=6.50 EC719839.1:161-442(+)
MDSQKRNSAEVPRLLFPQALMDKLLQNSEARLELYQLQYTIKRYLADEAATHRLFNLTSASHEDASISDVAIAERILGTKDLSALILKQNAPA